MTEFINWLTLLINWLTLIAPALPLIGIGVIFLFQSRKWWNTRLLFSRVVLMYGTFIIAVALILFATNSEIKQTPALQLSTFSLVFIFESFLWFEEENRKIIALIILIVGLFLLITGIVLSCFAANGYWWIPAMIYTIVFASPFIIFRKFLKGTSTNK
jgi:hypothetical protein